MRRRAAASVAGCVLALTVPAVEARATPVSVSVSAEGAASARVFVNAEVSFRFNQALVLARGDYAGLVVYGEGGTYYGGFVTVPKVSATGADRTPVILGAATGRTTLSRGWYRFVVLANAPVTITIPVESGSGLDVTATTPDVQPFQAAHRTLAAGKPVRAELRMPLPSTTPSQHVLVFGRIEPAYTQDRFVVVVCAPRRGRACAKDPRVTFTGSSGTHVVRATLVDRGLKGSRDAHVSAALTPSLPATLSLVYLRWDQPVRNATRRR